MISDRLSLPTLQRLEEVFEYRDGALFWKQKPHKYSMNVVGRRAGTAATAGYWRVKLDGATYFEHRLIYALHNDGKCPEVIDHIDGNKENNRVENLRAATISQNAHNAKLQARNTSGAKNVSWVKSKNRWRVFVTVNGKRKFWSFADFELAELFAVEARSLFFGEYANHGLKGA